MIMDRRDFLKGTLAGVGVLAASSSLSAAVSGSRKTAATPLKARGWVHEPARRLAVVDQADIVVVGGGPAGFAAAVSAARQGADVILLERQYFLGGLFTGCGVTPIINIFQPLPGRKKERAVSGIAEEFCDRLQDAGMLSVESVCRPKADPEAAKYFMEEMISQSGVRLIYGVDAVQVIRRGDAVESVILEGKSGRVAVNTKFVVDTTGDGDVLAWTGEDFNIYKDDIGAMWRIGNAGSSPKGSLTPTKGVRTRHMTGERNQDGLDMYNLTRIQTSLRKTMWEDSVDLRKNPGCEDLFLLDTPSVVGVRITRVLNSVGNVSYEGALNGKTYKDVIGMVAGDSAVRDKDGKVLLKSSQRRIWQVPYSSIVPKTVPNLLVAGRCFGFDRDLARDAREIGACLMTGQAAGIAAALAVRNRCSNRELDVVSLQKALRDSKVKLSL